MEEILTESIYTIEKNKNEHENLTRYVNFKI